MNCDAKSRGSSYTDVAQMLVPTHVSTCHSLGVLVAPLVQKVSRNTWRFQPKLLFHNLHKVSWSGFDSGSFCCNCCYWSSSSKSSNSYCKYMSPLSPCSWWSCYVPCPCCHGFVAHHGLTTHGGLDVMVLLLIMDLLLAMVLFVFLLFMFLVVISIYTLLGPALVGDMHFCINFFGRFTI